MQTQLDLKAFKKAAVDFSRKNDTAAKARASLAKIGVTMESVRKSKGRSVIAGNIRIHSTKTSTKSVESNSPAKIKKSSTGKAKKG